MKKDEILKHLRVAKSAHAHWVQKAKLLTSGLKMDEDTIPINSTECPFGKWFYSDGQILNGLPNNPVESMQHIEALHSSLHDVYLKIFSIYFSEDKKVGFLAKLFGMKRLNPSESEQELAKRYCLEIEHVSQKLIDEINKLERRLISVSNERIEALV